MWFSVFEPVVLSIERGLYLISFTFLRTNSLDFSHHQILAIDQMIEDYYLIWMSDETQEEIPVLPFRGVECVFVPSRSSSGGAGLELAVHCQSIRSRRRHHPVHEHIVRT